MRKRFDFRQFLVQHRIEFIDRGVNVKKNEINIKCPFCIDDPSYHLGVDEDRQVYSCWRSFSHRGRLTKLIMVLARCSYRAACELLGQRQIWFDKSEYSAFMDDPEGFFNDEKADDSILSLPKEFHEAHKGLPKRFEDYLVDDRGFLRRSLKEFCERYDLHYCVQGQYSSRLVIPVRLREDLLTYTCRSIVPTKMRYLTLSESDGAVDSIKELVLNFDVVEGNILFIVEGPFDALKLDFFGRKYGAGAVCLFGKNIKGNQALLIGELSEYFEKVVVLLDSSEYDSSIKVQQALSFIQKEVLIGELPDEVQDPGDLSFLQIKKLVANYV
jgi:hypothetical protein